jgi:D-psicose/D-tagatose/L-ribulose 3-epimerase
MPWKEIGDALHEIGYDGSIVMEPFVRPGGQVGKDISIWRDLSHGATDDDLSADAAKSVTFLRELWG